MKLYIGLMSGTSMDGIDAALLDVDTNRLIEGVTTSYSPRVKTMLEHFFQQEQHSLQAISQLNTLIGRDFALATQQLLARCNISHTDIVAIGSHGQTIVHDASADIPYTVQLGCPHTIAEWTKIPVVADFRTRDLVTGGQGAPLAPLYHRILFADRAHPLAIVNIGGIANLSGLIDSEHSIGYDVGPGNCLMDAWIRLHRGESYDAGGQWAAEGQVIDSLLSALLSDDFFKKTYPKSIGKEYYSLEWLNRFLHDAFQQEDVQATLLHLTAHGIANAIRDQLPDCNEVIICGGGAHNAQLLSVLSKLLPHKKVQSTDSIGIRADYIEAQMMAWLADRMLSKEALNLKEITGSKHKSILGVFYPAGIDN